MFQRYLLNCHLNLTFLQSLKYLETVLKKINYILFLHLKNGRAHFFASTKVGLKTINNETRLFIDGKFGDFKNSEHFDSNHQLLVFCKKIKYTNNDKNSSRVAVAFILLLFPQKQRLIIKLHLSNSKLHSLK